MLAELLILALLGQTPAASASEPAKTPPQKPTAVESDSDPAALLKVKRIFVDSFGEDVTSRELQSMIVSALVATNRFKVTENKDKADAILKGVALEKTSQEVHAYGEATSVGAASGGAHAEVSGGSGSAHSGFIGRHMGTEDSSLNTETIHEARVAVRLVNPDGDVIWTSTQESKGAKYKGSTADAADKCVKQLLHDIDKLKTANAPPEPSPASTTSAPK